MAKTCIDLEERFGGKYRIGKIRKSSEVLQAEAAARAARVARHAAAAAEATQTPVGTGDAEEGMQAEAAARAAAFAASNVADAIILARNTYECCVVYVVNGAVTKVLKDDVLPKQIIRRCAVAAAHPDLFAPMEYDPAAHAIRQSYIAEPAAIGVCEMLAELKRRGLEDVHDVSDSNIRGRVLVDFEVVAGNGTTP